MKSNKLNCENRASSNDIGVIKYFDDFATKRHIRDIDSKIDFFDKAFPLKDYRKFFQKPYCRYIDIIESIKSENMRILDIACGTGSFVFNIAKITNSELLGIDISYESIEKAEKTLRMLKANNRELQVCNKIKFKCENALKCDFQEDYFDLICMEGSFSCICLNDKKILVGKIRKWLKSGGSFVFVDSFGYNPLINLKRRFGKFKGYYVKNVPKYDLIDIIKNNFSNVNIEYYGIFVFLGPLLSRIIGDNMSAKIIDKLDKLCPFLKKYAYKIVVHASGIRK